MESRTGYALALALCVAIGVAALSTALWTADERVGLSTGELLRVEPLPEPTTPLDEQLVWTFEVLGAEREITQADLDTRFGETFGDAFDLDLFRGEMTAFFDEFGVATFVRSLTTVPGRSVLALGASGTGAPLLVSIELDDTGAFALWSIDDYRSGQRVPGWKIGLAVLAGWTALAASAALRRWGVRRQTWSLLALSLAGFSTLLVLSDDSVVYAIGRMLPTASLPIAVWLLLEPSATVRRSALATATLGAGLAAVAVLVRDPTTIGHPTVGGVDEEVAYRAVLSISALSAVAAMSMTAWSQVRLVHVVGVWRRPPHVAAIAVAATWAIAAVVAFVDLASGGGWAATGALLGVMMAMAGAVPFILLFRHVSSRWDRAELAGLVIDIGAGGTDLDRAVRAALDDDTAVVWSSPDGAHLVDDDGNHTDDDLAVGRALVQVRSGDELVGAIEYDAALPMEGERVGAIAAAVGLALRVERLNERVREQLEEAEASRARIVEASDEARRRVERDLHDGAQQRLVGLGMQLQRGRRLAQSGRTEDVAALLEDATAETRAAIDDLRRVSRGAPPALLTDRGLRAAVDALAERSPIPVDIDASDVALPDQVELTAYYVIAESMTNAAKHAAADSIGVSILRTNGAAIVRITDDGVGGAAPADQSGLEGLQDRVAAIGGDLLIDTGRHGTTIEARLPCG